MFDVKYFNNKCLRVYLGSDWLSGKSCPVFWLDENRHLCTYYITKTKTKKVIGHVFMTFLSYINGFANYFASSSSVFTAWRHLQYWQWKLRWSQGRTLIKKFNLTQWFYFYLVIYLLNIFEWYFKSFVLPLFIYISVCNTLWRMTSVTGTPLDAHDTLHPATWLVTLVTM